MILERGEVDQDAVETKAWHPATDSLLRVRRGSTTVALIFSRVSWTFGGNPAMYSSMFFGAVPIHLPCLSAVADRAH